MDSKRKKYNKSVKLNCKICGKVCRSTGLPTHIKYKHDMPPDEYAKLYGEFRQNKLNTRSKRTVSKIACKICALQYSMVGISNHLRDTHSMTTDEYVASYGEFRPIKLEKISRLEASNVQCEICKKPMISERSLTSHVRKEHSLKKIQYVTKYIFNDEMQSCKCGCGQTVHIFEHYPYRTEYISGHNSKGENNPNFGNISTHITKKNMRDAKFPNLVVRLLDRNLKPLFTVDEYQGIDRKYIYEFECTICNSTFFNDLRRSRIPSCKDCYNRGMSTYHFDLFEYLKSIYDGEIINNTRNIIPSSKEIDIYTRKEVGN